MFHLLALLVLQQLANSCATPAPPESLSPSVAVPEPVSNSGIPSNQTFARINFKSNLQINFPNQTKFESNFGCCKFISKKCCTNSPSVAVPEPVSNSGPNNFLASTSTAPSCSTPRRGSSPSRPSGPTHSSSHHRAGTWGSGVWEPRWTQPFRDWLRLAARNPVNAWSPSGFLYRPTG